MKDTKALSRVEIKDETKGEVTAIFATLNVIDSDGDVTVKGAFDDGAACAISAYGHQTWKGELPVGKGTIRETSTEAVFEGRFFMDTQAGADTFTVVKEMSAKDGPGQEWSYGLTQVQAEMGKFDGQRVRFIKGVVVPEVSPVLLGAGVNTRTVDAKGRALKQPNSEIAQSLRELGQERWSGDGTYVWCVDYDLDELWAIYEIDTQGEADQLVKVGMTRSGDGFELGADETEVEQTIGYAPKSASHQFTEHVQTVRAGLQALTTRTTDVMALRAQKGKTLATASADELRALIGDMKQLEVLLDTPAPTHRDDADEALAAEFLRFVASTHGA